MVDFLHIGYNVARRRACQLVGLNRSTYYYSGPGSKPRCLAHPAAQVSRASTCSCGYRRLHALLRREGWQVNHKLVQRLYQEEGLHAGIPACAPRAAKSKSAALARCDPNPLNQASTGRWTSCMISLPTAAVFAARTLVDHFSRVSPALEAGQSLTGGRRPRPYWNAWLPRMASLRLSSLATEPSSPRKQ